MKSRNGAPTQRAAVRNGAGAFANYGSEESRTLTRAVRLGGANRTQRRAEKSWARGAKE